MRYLKERGYFQVNLDPERVLVSSAKMDFEFSELNPVKRLALAYARHDVKTAFGLVLSLDARLSDVVLKASEPMIAQMKLAWWHDAIAKPVGNRPKGEPLLALLAQCEQSDVSHDIPAALGVIVDAWRVLAANEIWSSDVLDEFAVLRAEAVFGGFARWVRADQSLVTVTGVQWALADLVTRGGEGDANTSSLPRLPRVLRPLSILHRAAVQEFTGRGKGAGLYLVWHALTGR